jgi:hypothetical protein
MKGNLPGSRTFDARIGCAKPRPFANSSISKWKISLLDTGRPKTLTFAQGSSGTSTVTINPTNGFNQNVTLSASGLPTGVTASFSPDPATSTSTLTLAVSSSARIGSKGITITGTSGSLSHTTTVGLIVSP